MHPGTICVGSSDAIMHGVVPQQRLQRDGAAGGLDAPAGVVAVGRAVRRAPRVLDCEVAAADWLTWRDGAVYGPVLVDQQPLQHDPKPNCRRAVGLDQSQVWVTRAQK